MQKLIQFLTLRRCKSCRKFVQKLPPSYMDLPSEKWDLIPLHDATRADLDRVWQRAQGKHYDWAGAIGTVLKIRQRPDKWFCSEFCAAVMGIPDGWRFSPNDLAAIASAKSVGKM